MTTSTKWYIRGLRLGTNNNTMRLNSAALNTRKDERINPGLFIYQQRHSSTRKKRLDWHNGYDSTVTCQTMALLGRLHK